jgi:deoxyribodipyrimidine photo-lyase
MKNKLAIFWLRDDFRTKKNLALSYASMNYPSVSAIYILKKNSFVRKREAQSWWLRESLQNFKEELNNYNINLELLVSNSFEEAFNKLINKGSFSIYWNKVYEPDYLKFDKQIGKKLNENNIEFKIFKGNTLNEYQEITKKDSTPFKVFTAFWREGEKVFIEKNPSSKNEIKPLKSKVKFLEKEISFEETLPKKKWDKKFEKLWKPNEQEALNIIKQFVKDEINSYGELRDIPSIKGTSKISPYLAFGQIHVETIWELCGKIKSKGKGYRKYINELGWREFSHSLINYFPEMLKGNLRKEFDSFPWVKNEKFLKAWKLGKTGYPIVDAGMRELYETGWMHNRVRMITASFLVKHLRIHWEEGEKHFRNCLLDFNKANNVAGWQWVSGCGADAAPYFRIFNPILQGEKFDSKGEYVKKWVPELSNLPNEFIHKPWELKDKIKNFQIGKDYPLPIVDHKTARESALNAFKKIKK